MIDGFELKASSFNKQIFNISEEELNESGKFFNLNYYLYSCITDYEKLSYNYFESDTFASYLHEMSLQGYHFKGFGFGLK
mgnify:CR=1 FL=1